ncbi:hypothetical protein PoB_006559700 [Plakobranchus ocellatus]|uniref:Uncharacterized protein n=1 Tax=Plakobranchus ocellatus TaxID=259542 RepID=A0AAV4D4D9_9GAST|nr:hypothetical protein PoB_006559700 [Plakobranchus ocellatus]
MCAFICVYLRKVVDVNVDEKDGGDDAGGITGNDGSGNTSDDDGGNTGNNNDGNTGYDGGNTGNDGGANTSNDDGNNTGNGDSANTGTNDGGNTGNDGSGNAGKGGGGNTGNYDSSNTVDDDGGVVMEGLSLAQLHSQILFALPVGVVIVIVAISFFQSFDKSIKEPNSHLFGAEVTAFTFGQEQTCRYM